MSSYMAELWPQIEEGYGIGFGFCAEPALQPHLTDLLGTCLISVVIALSCRRWKGLQNICSTFNLVTIISNKE